MRSVFYLKFGILSLYLALAIDAPHGFGPERIAGEGICYNLDFDAYEDARAAWRYLDLTEHVEYLAHLLPLTIDQEMEMRSKASYLRSMQRCSRAD